MIRDSYAAYIFNDPENPDHHLVFVQVSNNKYWSIRAMMPSSSSRLHYSHDGIYSPPQKDRQLPGNFKSVSCLPISKEQLSDLLAYRKLVRDSFVKSLQMAEKSVYSTGGALDKMVSDEFAEMFFEEAGISLHRLAKLAFDYRCDKIFGFNTI